MWSNQSWVEYFSSLDIKLQTDLNLLCVLGPGRAEACNGQSEQRKDAGCGGLSETVSDRQICGCVQTQQPDQVCREGEQRWWR